MLANLNWCSMLVLAMCLLASCDRSGPEEMVHIPDAAFLNGLAASGVDKNGDGLISYREAEDTGVLLIPPSGISDLTGLEAFTKLDCLIVTLNPLTGIDLSGNTALRYLEVTGCELNSLDVSNNIHLEELVCGRNKLTELELSGNQALVRLACNNNLLPVLNLSANTGLTKMISCGNRLSKLDLSNHAALQVIGVDNMPMLTEVCVWTLPFPPEGIVVLQGFSPNIEYTTDCSR